MVAACTRNSKVIKAPREVVYAAFTDPAALVVWLPPGEMTGEVYSFDARVGGGYRMSLQFYGTVRGTCAPNKNRPSYHL
jgi:uncharacterized protein YndB with AHSA1/START domain